jgi:hypothetical protein
LAKLNTLPQLTSYAEVFLNIVNGKADITFAEPSAVNDFLKSNPGKIQRVGNTPVRTFENIFRSTFVSPSNSLFIPIVYMSLLTKIHPIVICI